MVKSHAISNATATVMPGDREARKAKPLHDDHHVLRHGALRIWCMVLGRDRATAAPIATQIGADYRKVTGKYRRDAAPHQVCLRKTVQQEDRRPGPGPAHKDTGLARLDLGSFEVIHYSKPCSSLRTRGYDIQARSVSPFDGRLVSTTPFTQSDPMWSGLYDSSVS